MRRKSKGRDAASRAGPGGPAVCRRVKAVVDKVVEGRGCVESRNRKLLM